MIHLKMNVNCSLELSELGNPLELELSNKINKNDNQISYFIVQNMLYV